LQFASQDCDGLSNTQLQTCRNPRSKKFSSSNVEVGKKSKKSFCKVEEDGKKVSLRNSSAMQTTKRKLSHNSLQGIFFIMG
jgi:hypothetical protein